MILLDTHVLLWVDVDAEVLGRSTRRLITQAWDEGQLVISAMSFWKCAMPDLLSAGLVELPLDGQISTLATELEPLHKDPANRLIAASAIAHSAILVTADERLLKCKHALKRQNALR